MYNLAPILYSSRQFYHRKVVNILTTSRFIFTIPYYIRHIFNEIVRIVTGIFKKHQNKVVCYYRNFLKLHASEINQKHPSKVLTKE